MEPVFYKKNKNKTFSNLESVLNVDNTQNYIPLYDTLFSLNETNKNSINLNNKWEISKIEKNLFDKIYEATVIDSNNKSKKVPVFFKFAPLLDPIKYLLGKYENINIEKLPLLDNNECYEKVLDVNNSAYIDNYFSYLSSRLLHEYGFIHGIDFYGGYLGVKNDFVLNIEDDIEYLLNSDYFNSNKNNIYTVTEEAAKYFDDSSSKNYKKKLVIGTRSKNISLSSVTSLNEESCITNNLCDICLCSVNVVYDCSTNKVNTSRTNSSCSSRSSLTDDEEDNLNTDDDKNEEEEEEESDEEDDSEDEEPINILINKFPVNIITLEACSDTLDNLIESDISYTEIISAFMQIIMTLLVYQKAFDFTHNDLHTNNIMFIETEKQYIYYCYEGIYYKVPTFKRIFKIIDFGRAIYKYNGNIHCSDSFHSNGDAATQYNFEPYFNENKPRLEPNMSFDLCRLACSLYDNLVDDEEDREIYNPVRSLVEEWCLDDKDRNVLYKKNGEERYPEFKLYKMIARTVHKHNPKKQLENNIFKNYIVSKKSINKKTRVINIDNIPSMV